MSVKNQIDWPIQKIKKWAKPALAYPELIQIARTAKSNTEAKNLALEFTAEQGSDEKAEEKVAMACRWLRILRTKLSEEELEHYIQEGKEMGENKDIRKIEIRLPHGTRIISEVDRPGDISLAFDTHKMDIFYLCRDLLEGINNTESWNKIYPLPVNKRLRDLMIKILEEKFGIRVKSCSNCKEWKGIECRKGDKARKKFGETGKCEHWAPKEKEVEETKKGPSWQPCKTEHCFIM